MKHILLCVIIGVLTAPLSSCVSSQKNSKERLSRIANIALGAAELTGKINPKQAALIRRGGALMLEAFDGGTPAEAEVSEIIVGAAVEAGAITPAQAEELREAGTTPFAPASASSQVFP